MANNLAARCVNGRGLLTLRSADRREAGRGVPGWEGNKCKHDLLLGRTCDGESPSDERQRRGKEGTKK